MYVYNCFKNIKSIKLITCSMPKLYKLTLTYVHAGTSHQNIDLLY